MHVKNAARVLPEPVGAAISVCCPRAMAGQPSACGSVGSPNSPANPVAHEGVEQGQRFGAWTSGLHSCAVSVSRFYVPTDTASVSRKGVPCGICSN